MTVPWTTRLRDFLSSRWDAWLLSIALGAFLIGSLGDTTRRFDGGAAALLAFTGLVWGLALAETRWRGWFAALTSLFLSVAITFQQVGVVLPSRAIPYGFWQWVDALFIRSMLLKERLLAWAGGLPDGGAWHDPGFQTLVWGFLAWNVAAWLGYLLRRSRALAAILPCGVLLAVNVYFQGQEAILLTGYLVIGMVALFTANYRRSGRDWDARGVDWPYTESILPDWGVGAGLSIFLVGAIALLAPTLATPEGWERIRKALEPPVVAVTPSAPDSAQQTAVAGGAPAATILSRELTTPRLDQVGAAPSTANNTLFWVTVSDPPPVGPMSAHVTQHRWRMAIFDDYTGSGWELADLSSNAVEQPEEAPDGRYLLEQRFELISMGEGGNLPSVNQPVRVEGAELRWTADGSALVAGTQEEYTVYSYATQVSEEQLRAAPDVWPDAVAQYLSLPDSVPERVLALADQVAASGDTTYDRALLVQTYLRENFTYDLETPLPPEGQDVVDYFLFDVKSGFCSYYASAMAVMLRAEGIPARVVSGFATGQFDLTRGGYRVPPSSAHAWVEVYFSGIGWVEFEPTPIYGMPIRLANEEIGAESEITPGGRVAARAVVTGAWIAGGVVALALAALLVRWLVSLRLHPLPKAPAERLYTLLRRALSRAGFTAKASVTPAEYLAQFDAQRDALPRAAQALDTVTTLLQQALFSPLAPDPRRYWTAGRALRRAQWELLGFRLARFLKAIFPKKS